jgi:protein involved in polysaccharide export with SLBB domain
MCAIIIRLVSLGLLFAIGLSLAGCYRDFGPVVAEPELLPPPAVTTLLQIGDKLTINVYDEPNLTGVNDITPAGVVVLPLIGAVKAAGQTPAELQKDIADRYTRGKFLKEAKVTVTVVEYRPISVFGEVVKAGSYPYRPGLNALTAINLAGGLTYRGSRDKIYLQRAGEQVWNEYPLLSSVTVMPGDLIRIPERYY